MKDYRKLIESSIESHLETFENPIELKDACHYSLMSGGKRIRPSIVLMLTESLSGKHNIPAALSVEFFHTASLIADDLPCMDNDDFRRNKESLHKKFNEATALLASYALITEAFHLIYEASKGCDADVVMHALQSASKASGFNGATGGQYVDLFHEIDSLSAAKDLIYKKTTTLFEVAFIFGWIFGGGDLTKLDLVKKLSYHFGLAFQLADDLDDLDQDGKNCATSMGKEKAFELLDQEIKAFNSCRGELQVAIPSFEEITGLAKSMTVV